MQGISSTTTRKERTINKNLMMLTISKSGDYRHINGTELRDKSEQTAKATCTLASLTPEIFDYLKADKPLFLK